MPEVTHAGKQAAWKCATVCVMPFEILDPRDPQNAPPLAPVKHRSKPYESYFQSPADQQVFGVVFDSVANSEQLAMFDLPKFTLRRGSRKYPLIRRLVP